MLTAAGRSFTPGVTLLVKSTLFVGSGFQMLAGVWSLIAGGMLRKSFSEQGRSARKLRNLIDIGHWYGTMYPVGHTLCPFSLPPF